MALKLIGDPVLRKKASEVVEIDEDTKRLIEDMIVTMHQNGGQGLAANQVGVDKRIIVLDVVDGTFDDRMPMAMINPKIIKYHDIRRTGIEGCLSVPGITAPVERSYNIDMVFTNVDGVQEAHKLSGMISRCVQHEVDHLDGIVYTDKIDSGSMKPSDVQKVNVMVDSITRRTERKLLKKSN